jgi:hypothetical protein
VWNTAWKCGDLGIITVSVTFWWVKENLVQYCPDFDTLANRVEKAARIKKDLAGHLVEMLSPSRHLVYVPAEHLYSILDHENYKKL